MKKAGFLAIAAMAALVLSGCTDSDAGTSASNSNASGDLTPVTIGVIPIADTAPVYLGVEQGFFEEEGLDLTIETASGGAAIIPAVVSGDYDFGFSNILSILVAAEQGIDVTMVSSAVASTGDPKSDFGAVVTLPDSGITTVADLNGHRVSSNSIGAINDTTVRAVVDAAGGDSTTIDFVEVPFPDAIAAVENDQIDAAFVVEPFLSAAKAAGMNVVSYAFSDFTADVDIAAYFGMQDQDPAVTEKFQAAMQKSLAYATENPDAVRDILATYTKTPEDVLAKMILPAFPTEINRAATEEMVAAGLTYGVLSKEPDLDALLP